MKGKIIMIGPDPTVKGGIASVVKGYLNSDLVKWFNINYISTHKDGNKIYKLYVALKGYCKIIINLIFNRPDIVHIHTSFGASFYRKSVVIILSKIFKIKIINHIHGAEFDKFYTEASYTKKQMVKYIYEKCDLIIVLSNEWANIVGEIVDKRKIEILENYAIIPSYIPEIKVREESVLFLGEIGKRKGAYDIPEVIKKVVSVLPNVKFYICGNGNHKKLNEMISKYDIDKNTIVKEWVGAKEKKELLEKVKIYFLPSYNEGLPMSILEGMSYGLPIVSTNIGGIPELIDENINGSLKNPGDKYGFAESIIQIFLDNELSERMSKNNIEKIVKGYSLDIKVKKVKELYNKVMNN